MRVAQAWPREDRPLVMPTPEPRPTCPVAPLTLWHPLSAHRDRQPRRAELPGGPQAGLGEAVTTPRWVVPRSQPLHGRGGQWSLHG